MKQKITTLFDSLAVLAISVGVAGALWPYIAWVSLVVSGFIILGASALAARVDSKG